MQSHHFEHFQGVLGVTVLLGIVAYISLLAENYVLATWAGCLFIPALLFTVIDWVLANAAVKREIREKQMEEDALTDKIVSEVSKLKTLGNTVIASGGANVVIGDRNTVTFLQNLAKTDPGLEDSLKLVTGAVEKSGNKEAGESWNDFLEELAGPKKKSKLANAWNGVLRLVPDIATFAESVAKITSIFA